MVRRDRNAIDLAQQKLRLADDVLVWPMHEAGESVYRLEIPSLHKFFRVGIEEYTFISLLDGNCTVPQACGLTAAKHGRKAPSGEQAMSIARWLIENELALIEGEQQPARDPKRPSSSEKKRSVFAKLNPFWIKVPLCREGDLLKAISMLLQILFRPLAVLCGLITILAGLLALTLHHSEFVSGVTNVFASNSWIWLAVFWVALKVIHELGHAACCHRFGGKVSEFGAVFILFAPLAYVDVSSCWRMPSRARRIAIASAGMYVELIVAAVAVFFWLNAQSPYTAMLLHNLILAAGVSTLLFNLNALMRFDGYFILSDLVEIPNLYGEASAELSRLSQRLFFAQKAAPCRYDGWRKYFVRAYAISAMFWKIIICVTLGIAAATMFSGAGIVLAVAGIAIWTAGPVIKFSKFLSRTFRREPVLAIRGLLFSSVVACMVLTGIFWMPIPTAIHVPAVVAFAPKTIVRARVSGFVKDVRAVGGDRVSQDDVIIVLENPKITKEFDKLQLSLQQNSLRQRKALDEQDPSASIVLREHAEAIKKQLAQLRQQVDALIIKAPGDGIVIARNLQNRLGSFVTEGDELLVVAKPSDKEIVALVNHRDFPLVKKNALNQVTIRTASFQQHQGKVNQIEPRATNGLAYQSLAASEGGPLAVRAGTETEPEKDQLRLLEPCFPVRVDIDDLVAKRLPAGMRLTTFFGYRRDTLSKRMSTAIRALWYSSQDAAK